MAKKVWSNRKRSPGNTPNCTTSKWWWYSKKKRTISDPKGLKASEEVKQNPSQRLSARDALKHVLVNQFASPNIHPTIPAAYSLEKSCMILASVYGDDVGGFDIWISSHMKIIHERLSLSPKYITEQSLMLVANNLGATPLPLNWSKSRAVW